MNKNQCIVFMVFFAASLSAVSMGALMQNKSEVIYTGQAFDIQLINGKCFAREDNQPVWFECNEVFKDKVLVRGK